MSTAEFPGHRIPRRAEGAITAFRILAAGSADGLVAQATAADDPLLGVNEQYDKIDGDHLSMCISGVCRVEYGGNVAYGDPLTADSQGRAIKATVDGSRCVGFATEAGDAGTLGTALLSNFTLSAPA